MTVHMTSNVKIYFIAASLIILGILALALLNPIMHTTQQDSELVTGVVAWIEESGGPGDVFIKLKDHSRNYYINRGTERGLDINHAKDVALHRRVHIYYARHWTPLDPFGMNKHVTKLVLGSEVLYDETR